MSGVRKRMECVLTVGSTAFSPLVSAFLSKPTFDALRILRATHLTVQIGTSDLPAPWALGDQSYGSIKVSIYRFLPDLEQSVASADLVVSHAGAGSILSFLRAGDPLHDRWLVVVPNSTLMDSHQTDLADELARKGWATVCTPTELPRTLASLREPKEDKAPLTPCPPFDPGRLAAIVDATLGF